MKNLVQHWDWANVSGYRLGLQGAVLIFLLALATPAMAEVDAPTADLTDDGIVNVLDISTLTGRFGVRAGEQGYREGLDLNSDGIINFSDIMLLLPHFGASNVATTPTGLTGRVFDGLGNSLEGVKVLVGTVMGVTNASGVYNLNIPPGETGETTITFDGSMASDPTPGGSGQYPTIPNKPIFINGGTNNVFRDISLPERDITDPIPI